jgi:hypothetical protein
MRAIARRVGKLESRRFDATGLVPYSEEWFEYYTAQLARSMDGKEMECDRMPIEVIDRLVELADREELERAAELSKQES